MAPWGTSCLLSETNQEPCCSWPEALRLGNCPATPEQLLGPLVLRIFPLEFPEAALAAAWQVERGIDIWEPADRLSKVTLLYSQRLYFLSVWGFFSRISQFALYLSGLSCWREE